MAALHTSKMATDSTEMKEMAARICRDYLHGAWKHVSPQEIGLKRISGGLSNWLYHVWLPTDVLNGNEGAVSAAPLERKSIRRNSLMEDPEPNQVLLRIYGQVHGERALEQLITESVIFTLLSERRLGPRLHGVFPGGRIEQYIHARPLLTAELARPDLSTQIARKMGAIHNMEVPISKEPSWLWRTSEKWLNTIENNMNKQKMTTEHTEQILKVKNYDLKNELVWLKTFLIDVQSPVIFSHNDMQEGNILISQDEDIDVPEDDQLVLIDFEYCSYNYRGFDIANHFIEWTYDYTNPEYPYYYELPDKYPSEQQQRDFIQEYLKVTESTSSTETVLAEIRAFTLASHFFWGLWACANAPVSQIPFGYWDYALTRLDRYFLLKQTLISLQPISVKRSLHDSD